MDLIERKREEHRSRTLQRIGSVLVCMSLLLAVAFPPQEAKAAFVLDDMAVASVAAAFLASCGMTFAASGMDSSGVAEQVGKVIDNYISSTGQSISSRVEWLAHSEDESEGMQAVADWKNGCMVIKSEVANKLADFARWVQGEYEVEAGKIATVYTSGLLVRLSNGVSYTFTIATSGGSIVSLGTTLPKDNISLYFDSGYYVKINGSYSGYDYYIYSPDDGQKLINHFDSNNDVSLALKNGTDLCFAYWLESKKSGFAFDSLDTATTAVILGALSEPVLDLGCSPLLSIPDTIPADQEVAISTGAASDLTLDDALDQILAAIAAGQLSATKEIADAGTAAGEGEIVTPIDETMPDVGELGLPALGEALTTRFPFSIPWDVTRAIKLLAAPAKTPYFEVDFFAPVADTFGGFPASTKVVLDFSQFEILGQLSRWTSTIGFCLLLASGTKKLIWTA